MVGAAEGGGTDVVAMGTACADGVAHLWSINGKHLRTLRAGTCLCLLDSHSTVFSHSTYPLST